MVLSSIYAVLFYIATMVLGIGLAYRIYLYARTPAPLKIPTTPAPVTRTGVGMTLSSGCGQRTLLRFGGGNLKSLVVIVFLGVTAYMTMRGLWSLVRVNAIDVTNVNLAGLGIPNRGIGTLLAAATGLQDSTLMSRIVAVALGGGLVVYAFAARTFRGSFNNILAGVITGLIIPAGWYITGVLGYDDFD